MPVATVAALLTMPTLLAWTTQGEPGGSIHASERDSPGDQARTVGGTAPGEAIGRDQNRARRERISDDNVSGGRGTVIRNRERIR